MFRLKISWGLAVCLALFLAETGNAASRVGGFPAPRGEAAWLDLETLWARAWSWLRDLDVSPKHGAAIDPNGGPKHGSSIDPNGDPKHGWETDSGGAPPTTAGACGQRVPVIGLGRSN